MGELDGKVAVVTGAGRGLGQRAAMRLARLGAQVALVARSPEQVETTATLIRRDGGRSLAVPGDVSRPAAVQDLKTMVEKKFGAPSILVNAAGVFGPIDLVWKTDPTAWIETLMINTVAAYLTCRAFAEGMIAGGWGRIINVTSAAALHEPGPINSAYGTSKAALNQFTRHLAAELAGTGVTANVIHPGDVKTDMWETIRVEARKVGPMAQRYLEWADWVEATGGDDPEKAADLITELASDKAGSVSGRFLWIKDGLQDPVPSWGDPVAKQPWQDR
jgi:NAD(P)-dependent dehydrogenase (short-subunit alcohol dehydrogenase family)